MKTSPNKHIIVGMSGGVDSSVAAYLLKQQGYKVEGLFMKNWEEDDSENHCNAAADLAVAEQVCDLLDIPLHTVNFARQYWDSVFETFLEELKKGRTPNPDILCNREIKFKVFLDYALSLGADAIATGHYAKKQEDATGSQLLKAQDLNKDQSYFLYTLTQKALSKVMFPIGDLPKTEVRRLAQAAGFPNHQKKDSTGICFIGERNFSKFLKPYFKDQPGNIETPEGRVIGQHRGLMYYTLGQRQGLGIGGLANSDEAAWYVVAKDLERNILQVAQGDHPLLYRQELEASDCHFINGHPQDFDFKCHAKIRYRQEDQACRLQINADQLKCSVIFEKPQRAITPGQSVVFYHNNICLGGAVIQ